jgi:hypothetical protein
MTEQGQAAGHDFYVLSPPSTAGSAKLLMSQFMSVIHKIVRNTSKYCFYFNLCLLFLQTATKLLGQKHLLSCLGLIT